jgi:hypothetical protein
MSPRSGIREAASRLGLDLLYGSVPPADGAFRSAVPGDEEGSVAVRDELTRGRPLLVGRLGSSELACVSFYTRWRAGRGVSPPYPRELRRVMRVNAGVFPIDDRSLDRFSEVFLAAVSQVDVMGVWFNRNEHRIVERYCPEARLVHLEALNPVLRKNPWSTALAGRTVLVVHPFAHTIESQYRTNRTRLFADPDVLPEFTLKTIQAVQSGAGGSCAYEEWFGALDAMRRRIAGTDFDVAIIGAGAYGLPLAADVKEMGRQAVHLGGATQLLFGVRGRRWEVESEEFAPLFNEYWVRPSAQETPSGSEQIEGGCYW